MDMKLAQPFLALESRAEKKRDLSGLCPFPPKTMTWCEQKGGGDVSGSKTVFGEGFYGVFSPPLSCPSGASGFPSWGASFKVEKAHFAA